MGFRVSGLDHQKSGEATRNNNAPSPRKRAQRKRTHCSRGQKTWYTRHFVHAHMHANKAYMQPHFT